MKQLSELERYFFTDSRYKRFVELAYNHHWLSQTNQMKNRRFAIPSAIIYALLLVGMSASGICAAQLPGVMGGNENDVAEETATAWSQFSKPKAKLIPSSRRGKNKQPNILFCIADDWGWPHAGAYGNDDVVKTPAFDRLAREGMLFEHAYVSSPSCTPSRNAILTGQYHWRLGAGGNLHSILDTKH